MGSRNDEPRLPWQRQNQTRVEYGNKRVVMAILGRSVVRVGSGHLRAVNQGFKGAKIRFDYAVKQIRRCESRRIERMTVSRGILVEREGNGT